MSGAGSGKGAPPLQGTSEPPLEGTSETTLVELIRVFGHAPPRSQAAFDALFEIVLALRKVPRLSPAMREALAKFTAVCSDHHAPMPPLMAKALYEVIRVVETAPGHSPAARGTADLARSPGSGGRADLARGTVDLADLARDRVDIADLARRSRVPRPSLGTYPDHDEQHDTLTYSYAGHGLADGDDDDLGEDAIWSAVADAWSRSAKELKALKSGLLLLKWNFDSLVGE
jgi:hypothetical protein